MSRKEISSTPLEVPYAIYRLVAGDPDKAEALVDLTRRGINGELSTRELVKETYLLGSSEDKPIQ